MRWTRLLSGILGTWTSTTCFRMRSETRSGVIPLIRFRVCDSSLIDGTVFRSATLSRESAQIAVPRHGLSWICGGLVNVFLSPTSVVAS